jgi:NlpC/P60 family putative phage cell wall peptidase
VSGDRHDIVDRARRWIGTPYVHQARRWGVGCDCLGLVLGVWEERFGHLPASAARLHARLVGGTGARAALACATTHLVEGPLLDPSLGDVLLFRMRRGAVAKHLGVQSALGPEARFIHAYSGRGVVETRLTSSWSRRIVARFGFPEGT